MKYYILPIILLFATNFSIAQTDEQPIFEDQYISEQKTDALYILDSVAIDRIGIDKINPLDFDEFQVVKNSDMVNKYGDDAKNGVVFITSKKDTRWKMANFKALYAKKFKSNTHLAEIEISGVVESCQYSVPLAKIKILNTNKEFETDFNGKFKFRCNVSDVISISAPHLLERRIIVYKSESKLKIRLADDPASAYIKGTVAKPVIYLYPEKEEDITLKINFKGQFATTYPKYENNWKVKAYPDGKIWDTKTKRFYTSLFWDGEIHFKPEHYQYKEGFVVEKNNLVEFLTEKLEHIGLNNYETNDFIQYWLPILEKNEFNFIHFIVNDDYKQFSENIIEPQPETSIRIMMEFHKTEKPFEIKEQHLPKTERKGFTLVEWGGSDVSKIVSGNNKLNF
jgi:hypothetical protein